MSIGAGDRILLNIDRRNSVRETVSRLRNHFGNEKWLPSNNRYLNDAIIKIKHDIDNNLFANSSVRKRHLAQYIGVSSVIHCSDGWGFLSSSLSALSRGDHLTALHLAYYAELRAAFSLLATQGIGVFNNKHFIIDSTNSSRKLNGGGGTHQFVWNCLDVWSQNSSSSDLLSTVIKPENIELHQWFSQLGGTNSLHPQAQDWFVEWGIDLKHFQDDQNARNKASYRPSQLGGMAQLNAIDSAKFITELWDLSEPAGTQSFGKLDKFLLRISAENLYKGRTGYDLRSAGPIAQRFIDDLLETLPWSRMRVKSFTSFLFRKTLPDDPLVLSYSKIPATHKESAHWGIISRAFLMLRVSTGATEDMLSEAGVTHSDLNFWRSEIAQKKGLWDTGNTPEEMNELWYDVDDALDEIQGFIDGGIANDSFSTLKTEHSKELAILSDYERIPLWGIRA